MTCFSCKEGVTLRSETTEAAAVLSLFCSLASLRSRRRMKSHNPSSSTATTVNAPIMKASSSSTAISNCCDQNRQPVVAIIFFNGIGIRIQSNYLGLYTYDFTFSFYSFLLSSAPYLISSFIQSPKTVKRTLV